jgi:flavorubredoxin
MKHFTYVTLFINKFEMNVLAKVFIAYDSKYGNTKLAAEKIMEGMMEVEGIETAIGYIKEINVNKLDDFDAIVLGAPNHMGRPSQAMKKFVNKLAELDLKSKKVVVFGTYAGKIRILDRAVKKLENIVATKLPNFSLISLGGLSVRVNKIRGPIIEGELPKCINFGKKLANQLNN